jgi:hypothetical protein
MAITRDQALAYVTLHAQTNSYPELDVSTVGTFVDSNRRYSTWTANTTYAVGDYIVPTVPNGRIYKAVVSGTSSATEPGFPVYVLYKSYRINDGTALIWQDYGLISPDQYDTRSAVRSLWIYKAGILANQVDASDDRSNVKLSLLQSQFLTMAEKYRPFEVIT